MWIKTNATQCSNRPAMDTDEEHDGMHYHRCDCGQRWEHSDDCANNVDAHTCTNCGQQIWYKDNPISKLMWQLRCFVEAQRHEN